MGSTIFKFVTFESSHKAAKPDPQGIGATFCPSKIISSNAKAKSDRVLALPKRVALAPVARVTAMSTGDAAKHNREAKSAPHHSHRNLRSMDRITEAKKRGGQLTGANSCPPKKLWASTRYPSFDRTSMPADEWAAGSGSRSAQTPPHPAREYR